MALGMGTIELLIDGEVKAESPVQFFTVGGAKIALLARAVRMGWLDEGEHRVEFVVRGDSST